MPQTKYIEINVGGNKLEVSEIETTGIAINYALEDPENFSQKQSSTSFGLEIPATIANDKAFNTFWNPNIEDLTADEIYKSLMDASITANGVQIMKGLAILTSAEHTNKPEKYTVDIYGNNGDWLLQMQNLTLWDCLSTVTHSFDVATIVASWTNYMNGGTPTEYVYTPVRYRQPFGNNGGNLNNSILPDSMVTIFDLKPSLSIYAILQRGFNQFGYSIKSDFINSNFFKRLTMPWTWGDFFDVTSQLLDALRFKAVGAAPAAPPISFRPPVTDPRWFGFTTGGSGMTETVLFLQGAASGVWKSTVISGNTFQQALNVDFAPNGFDNSGNYSFNDSTGIASWIMNIPDSLKPKITTIGVNFQLNLICRAISGGNDCRLSMEYSKNGGSWAGCPFRGIGATADGEILHIASSGTIGDNYSPQTLNFTIPNLSDGDVLQFRFTYNLFGSGEALEVTQSVYLDSTAAQDNRTWTIARSTFELTSFEINIGSSVNFQWYDSFRSYRFLDFVAGLIDSFDLEPQTDPISKIVTIEPVYPYELPNGTSTPDQMDGYFLSKLLDWSGKQDLTKNNVIELFSGVERQLDFAFKQDGSDGGQNIYAGRYKGIYLNNVISEFSNNTNLSNGINNAVPGASRYLFPDRFQWGSQTKTNRFFSATMHYNATQWQSIDGVAPQLVAIIPENVSNTSAADISQTFQPKICYYKGLGSGIGKYIWGGDPTISASHTTPDTPFPQNIPLLFAVNYGPNGQYDPVLSYCDQKINGVQVAGFMNRHFLTRLAIMRNGKLYSPWMHLNLNDITNWEHREGIIIKGARYYLVGIDNYKPLTDESTKCKLWKFTPASQIDVDNSFPSSSSVMTSPAVLDQYDLKYAPLLLYTTDLPQL